MVLSASRKRRLTRASLDELPDTDAQLPLLRYMLEGFDDSYGFPGWDYRHFVRTALEMAAPKETLTYDLSDLVAGGWVDEADELVGIAENLIDEDFVVSKRVIVLTEGDVDRQALERSLRGCFRSLRIDLYYSHYAQTLSQRSHRRTVGCSRSPAPTSQTWRTPAHSRPAGGGQRHPVRASEWMRLAYAPQRSSSLANSVQILSEVDNGRNVETGQWDSALRRSRGGGQESDAQRAIIDSQSVKTTEKGGLAAMTQARRSMVESDIS